MSECVRACMSAGVSVCEVWCACVSVWCVRKCVVCGVCVSVWCVCKCVV